MWNRILGIAALTVRQAVRSRFVLCLLIFMLVLLAGFAFTIKGDGTASGRIEVLVAYTIGTAGAVLGLAMLWLACGTFSVEIEDRRLHLVLVKPVRYVELWMGKWLGVVSVAALMLLVVGTFLLGAGAVARWRTIADSKDGMAVRDRILIARQRCEGTRVARPEGAQWRLDCPDHLFAADAAATLEYEFVSPLRDQPPVHVQWEVLDAEGTRCFAAEAMANMDGVNRLEVPMRQLPAGETLQITFRIIASEGDHPQHVTFHPDRPVTLLVPTGGFSGNVLRAMLLMFCRIALLAALGVTVGTVFTFPVTVFVAVSVVIAALLTQSFSYASSTEQKTSSHQTDTSTPAWVEWAGVHLAKGMRVVVAPALRYRVRGRLSKGVEVSWAEVYEAAGLLVFTYGAFLCAVACGTLRRREIALPV